MHHLDTLPRHTHQRQKRTIAVTNTEGTDTLTATARDANGISSAINYQWQISYENGSTWSNIGTNTNTHTITTNDVGKSIQVIANHTDDGPIVNWQTARPRTYWKPATATWLQP